MPKVSKLKLCIKTQYGEDYEIHYNAKEAPLFSIKGLPEDFFRVTNVYTHGYSTEAELSTAIQKALYEYKKIKETQRKVILYKASASAELTMVKIKDGHYHGSLNGISKKLDNGFGHSAEVATFGISYRIMMEVNVVNTLKYHSIKEDGTLGYSSEKKSKEQVLEWTPEAEAFFESIYESMKMLVLKMSKFIEQTPEEVALFIESNQKLLSTSTLENKKESDKCYLCKETEDDGAELLVEGDRYVCTNCLTNR